MKIKKFADLLNEARDLKLEKEMKDALTKELKSVKMSRFDMIKFIENKYKSSDNVSKVSKRIVDDVIYKERAKLKKEAFKKKNAATKTTFHFLGDKAKEPKGYTKFEPKQKEKKEPIKKEKKAKKEGGENLKFGTKAWREFHGVGKKNETKSVVKEFGDDPYEAGRRDASNGDNLGAGDSNWINNMKKEYPKEWKEYEKGYNNYKKKNELFRFENYK